MKIGNKLRALRTSKGYDSTDVAEKLGVSKTTYGRYERNETAPDINMIEKIANLYDIEIYELLIDDKLVFNQNNKKGDNNGVVINYLSEKLIEQYEIRIKEKDEIIRILKENK